MMISMIIIKIYEELPRYFINKIYYKNYNRFKLQIEKKKKKKKIHSGKYQETIYLTEIILMRLIATDLSTVAGFTQQYVGNSR